MTENKVFEKADFRENLLPKDSYEDCTFKGCNFNSADMAGLTFINCRFDGCDLSLANLKNTSLQEVKFISSKLLGIQFSDCRKFLMELDFENCIMKLSLFSMLKLKNTRFKNCELQETDFSEADLTGAIFDECDLLRTIFFHTNLEKADFSSARNYSINPEINRLKKARFSIPGIVGLLDTYNIEISE